MDHFKPIFFTLLLIIISHVAYTQSLQEKYNEMLDQTETYDQYKVIPRSRLNNFWSEVADSLRKHQTDILSLTTESEEKQADIESLSSKLADVQTKLDESLELNDSIRFIGISFSKLGYHIFVWTIIVILAALGVVSYLMFLRSNRVTTRMKKDYEMLDSEFDQHKAKARETQVKLKRELQTAVNQLNERR